jgi:crotonobetainyl-CoA:carnitine CoA-transferase CaiB-like acyl-CoA transferase
LSGGARRSFAHRVKPLEDIRIVAVEQFGAGPFGTLHLADLGAEVIKVEDPSVGGDVGRYVPPYAHGEDSLFFETFNRNKRSVSIDLSTPGGRGVFEDLVRVSDAVFANVRGDVPERMRIRYADLAPVNPRIVCCLLSGFGMTGPARAELAYDYILQGRAGWMELAGEPGGPPTKTGLSMVDYSGGLVAAISLLSAVHAARRDGVGCDCDVSLFDTAVSLINYPATWSLTAGYVSTRTRHSAHPSVVPFQNFQTADGWIVVACVKEKFWQRLTAVLDRPELAADERFASLAARAHNAAALIEILDERFATRTTAQWLEALAAAGVPNGPVNTVEQALADPQTAARELIVETEHPHWGTVRQLASPVRVGSERPSYRRAPRRNEDADHVLGTVLGYDAARIEQLSAAGAFGS